MKLIFKNTYDDEENGQPKKYSINAKSALAPEIFYFVHIEVDLDQVQNCTTQRADCEDRVNDESDFDTSADSQDFEDYQDSEFSKKRRGNREGEVFESFIQVQTDRDQGQYQR